MPPGSPPSQSCKPALPVPWGQSCQSPPSTRVIGRWSRKALTVMSISLRTRVEVRPLSGPALSSCHRENPRLPLQPASTLTAVSSPVPPYDFSSADMHPHVPSWGSQTLPPAPLPLPVPSPWPDLLSIVAVSCIWATPTLPPMRRATRSGHHTENQLKYLTRVRRRQKAEVGQLGQGTAPSPDPPWQLSNRCGRLQHWKP